MAPAGNPLREALEARDPEMARAAFAEDVIIRSPIFSVEFDGPDEATDVFAAVYEALGRVEYLYDEPGDPHVFVWRSDVDGEPLEGTDLIRYDENDKITEVTVFMRPLRGIASFLDKTGPILAKRRGKSPLLIKAAAPPPSAAMRMVAALGPRMMGLRRAKR
jgi:uncharacterized protein involved in tellurium resistance